jgi:hypothetical protein
MESRVITRDKVQIVLSRGELVLVNNALNEILDGIDVPESETRLGSRLHEARALMDAMGRLPSQME